MYVYNKKGEHRCSGLATTQRKVGETMGEDHSTTTRKTSGIRNGYYSNIPDYINHALIAANASGREFGVLIELMHHGMGQNGEIGASKNGYVMSSQDIADATGLSRGVVKNAIAGLRKKGVIETARYVTRNKMKLAVYRIAVKRNDSTDATDATHAQNELKTVSETPKTYGFGCGAGHESMAAMVMNQCPSPISTHSEARSYLTYSHQPTKRESNEPSLVIDVGNQQKSEIEVIKNETKRFRITPYYDYPTTVDEVEDFYMEACQIPEFEFCKCMVWEWGDPDTFFDVNTDNDWYYPDGSPILDWKHAALCYALGKAREIYKYDPDMYLPDKIPGSLELRAIFSRMGVCA